MLTDFYFPEMRPVCVAWQERNFALHGLHEVHVEQVGVDGRVVAVGKGLQQQQAAGRTSIAVPELKTKGRRGQSDEPLGPRLTLPAVRRARQRLLMPTCHLECPYGRALVNQ
jgi:hypothetical protein